jgi:mutator protein MutT
MVECEFEDGNKANLRHVGMNTVVLNDKNQILLVRRAAWMKVGAGLLVVPGGYLDMNETVEQGARREVLEETGFEVGDMTIFLIDSSTNVPGDMDRQNVSFNFFAKVGRKVGEHDKEVSEIIWSSVDNLPKKNEFAFAHYEIIEKFLKKEKLLVLL